jgi:hypothetical protein
MSSIKLTDIFMGADISNSIHYSPSWIAVFRGYSQSPILLIRVVNFVHRVHYARGVCDRGL